MHVIGKEEEKMKYEDIFETIIKAIKMKRKGRDKKKGVNLKKEKTEEKESYVFIPNSVFIPSQAMMRSLIKECMSFLNEE